MPKIVLQPASKGPPKDAFEATVENPIALMRIRETVLPAEWHRLSELYPDGEAPVWGVRPGRDLANVARWQRVQAGDIVLFSGERKIYASAVVTMTARSPSAAEEIWSQRKERFKSELLMFLTHVRGEQISHAELLPVAGFSPGYYVNRFNCLTDERSARIIERFSLGPPQPSPG